MPNPIPFVGQSVNQLGIARARPGLGGVWSSSEEAIHVADARKNHRAHAPQWSFVGQGGCQGRPKVYLSTHVVR